MLTIKADDHALIRNMHRPDTKRPLKMQDKRMVVILPDGLYEAWLDAPAADSMDFMRQFRVERLLATPEPVAAKPSKSKSAAAVWSELL